MKPTAFTQELNTKMTCSRFDDHVEILIEDGVSGFLFAKVEMTVGEFYNAFSQNRAFVPCKTLAYNSPHLGKKMHHTSISVELPEGTMWHDVDAAKTAMIAECEDWTARSGIERVPDLSFNSQGSFFKEGGRDFARGTVRWYTDPEDDVDVQGS